MSLPQFDVQGSLFESLGAIAPDLFSEGGKYKLFAKKIWPVLAGCREQLMECYEVDNGRPGVEPVVLLGVLIFQFLERVPDRQAVELVKYHLGWKLALNLKLSEGGFHATTLVYFRQRLIEHGKQVSLLREVFAQQFVVEADGKIEPVKVHATGVVQNPHDPQAEWSAKGRGKHKKEWVGYKVQVAETVPKEEGQIGFITSVVTQRASESDDPGLELTLEKQAQMGLERPSEMYVDGAYISAGSIQEAKEQDWNLMGPAQPSAARTGLDKAYRIEAFDISISDRKAICPAGKTSTQCSQLTEQKSGKVNYRFEFGRQCRDCPARSPCVPKDQPHRTIVVGALHEVLQQRRREQQSPKFKLQMQQRNGIEGSISELVRAHGLRRTRYKGFAKVDLQNQLVAAACNVKRWLQKLIKATSQTDREVHSSHQRLLTCSIVPLSAVFSRWLARLAIFDFFGTVLA